MRALEGRTASLGPQHPSTLASMKNLAVLRFKQGAREEAAALAQQAADGFQAALGPDHPSTQSTSELALNLKNAACTGRLPGVVAVPGLHEHELSLREQAPYEDGSYCCDVCGVGGWGAVYVCERGCGFDCHPLCVAASAPPPS